MFKLKIAARKRAIFAAYKALGIADDSERHGIQRAVVGKQSLTDMSLPELDTLLDHLNGKTRRASHHEGRPEGIADDPQLQKIEALLADQKLPWAYLHRGARGPSMCRRLTGKDRIEWADAAGKQAVIAALVRRQQKQGSARG